VSRQQWLARLREADAGLAALPMSTAATRRIADELARRGARPVLGLRPAVAVAVVVAVVLVAWIVQRPAPQPARARMHDAVTIAGPDCRAIEAADALALEGACDVQVHAPAMRIQSSGPTRIATIDRDRVALLAGAAVFEVHRRNATDPVFVDVGDARIEVIGTRFRVDTDGTRGTVALFEGRIALHDARGTTHLVAGDVVAFGDVLDAPAEPAPAPAASAPPPAADPEPPPRVRSRRAAARPSAATPTVEEPTTTVPNAPDAIVAEIRRLRAAGDYRAAVARLTAALREPWPDDVAEVLSYELGALLGRQLHDRARACDHWDAHVARFGTARYGAAIDRARARLECDVGTSP
jgi:hypothetical protein